MARLQVLPLPAQGDGLDRYAFIIDQAAELSPADCDALRAFATSAGGQGVVIVAGELVVDQPDTGAAEALTAALRDAVAIPDLPEPQPMQQPQQPAKLPPPNTTEGKLARVWGGNRPAIGAPQ